MSARPTARFVASHPAHLVAFGFGAGLSPWAPGTMGTLLAWPFGWALAGMQRPSIVLVSIAALFLLGVWACGLTGRSLGMPDYGGMVWDEVVAFLLILVVVPRTLPWEAAAFLLFRLFDIAKPPPIRWLERRYRGGFGVMADDLLAAGYTLFLLALIKRVFF